MIRTTQNYYLNVFFNNILIMIKYLEHDEDIIELPKN